MSRVGTSHFVSLRAAARYYKGQNENRRDVERKLREGLIHIGPPEIKAGERLEVIDNGTRYAIVSPERKG